MNIMRGDKVVLVKGMDSFKKVGETFEIANITETKIILREVTSKIAVGAVDIDAFETHFKKPEEISGWTKWEKLVDHVGNVIAHYRTNGKKVQVRTPDGYRSEATCHKVDNFDVFFGIQLAYSRCLVKSLSDKEDSLMADMVAIERELGNVQSVRSEVKHAIKMMVNSLELPQNH